VNLAPRVAPVNGVTEQPEDDRPSADIDTQKHRIDKACADGPSQGSATFVRFCNAAPRRDAQTVQIGGQSVQAVKVPWAHLRIPAFPQIAIRVLQLTNNEDVSMRQLGDLISFDPSFSSEVLTIANSALYAPWVPVTSILQAIAVLGLNRLRGVCLTVAVRAYLGKSLNRLSLRAIWRHSLACALIAEHLAQAGSMNRNTAYTAGILHDIGRFAMMVIRPETYDALLVNHSGFAGSLLPHEQRLFGFDHCEAGRHLIADWKLPADFEAIVSEHHSPRRIHDSWNLAALVNVSCRMADTIGFAVFPGCEVTPYVDLLGELPEQECRMLCIDQEALAFEVSSKINAVEQA
jgi:putative nucleotidyltransferase with HDIG domain